MKNTRDELSDVVCNRPRKRNVCRFSRNPLPATHV